MNYAKLADVAPAQASDQRPGQEDVVWHLGLEQIESGTGALLGRELLPARKAGSSTFVFDQRNVLYSKLRPYLNKVVCPDSIGIATSELVPLRPDPSKLDRRYLCYYLRSPAFVSWVSDKVAGAKMPRVKMDAFWKHEIPLPPLDDQKRIAYLLSKVEGLIAQRKQHLQQLNDLLKSVFHDMFGDPVRNEKGWTKRPLADVLAKVESGKSPKCEPRPATANEWGVLKLGAVTSCVYEDGDNKALPNDVTPHTNFEVKEGDVLFSRKNTYELVAACAYVFSTRPRLLLPDLIFRLVIKDQTEVNPIFLWRLLVSPSQRQVVQSTASGAAGSMPNISKANLIQVQIPCPPISMQDRFAAFVCKVENIKAMLQGSLDSLESLFASFSDNALKGKIELSGIKVPRKELETQHENESIDQLTDGSIAPSYELPDPSAYPLDESARISEKTLLAWLTAYSAHCGKKPISADRFLMLVDKKLTEMSVERYAEWIPGTVDQQTYDLVKKWIFRELEANRLHQRYDDKTNRVRVSAAKE